MLSGLFIRTVMVSSPLIPDSGSPIEITDAWLSGAAIASRKAAGKSLVFSMISSLGWSCESRIVTPAHVRSQRTFVVRRSGQCVSNFRAIFVTILN